MNDHKYEKCNQGYGAAPAANNVVRNCDGCRGIFQNQIFSFEYMIIFSLVSLISSTVYYYILS